MDERYEKALERAKSAIKECGDNKGRISMIESIFPELAESEDEKIRKEIIDRLKWELQGAEDQDAAGCSRQKDIAIFKRGIAWLEKQKYTQRDVDDAYLKGVTDTKNILENRGKQTNFSQNVSLTEFEEALADVCRGWIGEEIEWKDYIIRNANALLKICQKMWNEVQDTPFEQSPAWSKEDDYVVKELGGILYNAYGISDDERETCTNWLKSIEGRVQPQPRQWRDEDEENLQHCCGAIAAADYYTIEDKQEMIDWLKSFKTTNVGNSSITVEGMYNPAKDASV